jgi:hypothetical protein
MQTKRSMALTIGSLVLAAPALAACGMSPATNQIYTPAAGVNDRSAQVDVLNAAIVSTDGGTGTFIAGLANGSTTEGAALEAISGVAGDGTELVFPNFEPVELTPQGYVDLADGTDGVGPGPGTAEAGIAPASRIDVAGTFALGEFVRVSLTFADGSTVDLNVPVLPNNDEYAGIDGDELTPTQFPAQDVAEEQVEHGGAGGTEDE